MKIQETKQQAMEPSMPPDKVSTCQRCHKHVYPDLDNQRRRLQRFRTEVLPVLRAYNR